MTFKCHFPLESLLYQLEKIRIFGRSRNKITSKWQTIWIIAFSTSSKLHFRLFQRPKISWECHASPWNNAFWPSSRVLRWSRFRKWVPNVTRPLETSFLAINYFAFWSGQEEENEFRVPGDHLKHRFLDLTKVEFWAFQEAENEFLCRSASWIFFYRLEKIRNFVWSRSKKRLQSDIRQLESSFFRLHPNRILG